MACRDCKLLDVPLNSAGRRIPRKGSCYPCRAEVPPVPLPRSARSMDFALRNARMQLSYMEPDEGDNCFYHQRVKPHGRS